MSDNCYGKYNDTHTGLACSLCDERKGCKLRTDYSIEELIADLKTRDGYWGLFNDCKNCYHYLYYYCTYCKTETEIEDRGMPISGSEYCCVKCGRSDADITKDGLGLEHRYRKPKQDKED